MDNYPKKYFSKYFEYCFENQNIFLNICDIKIISF